MLTDEQKAAVKLGLELEPGESFIVNAVAGSGKTTLLTSLAGELVARGDNVIAITFTKMLQQELADKMPMEVDCYTLHKLCLILELVELTDTQQQYLGAMVAGIKNPYFRYPTKRLVGLALNSGLGLNIETEEDSLASLFENSGLQPPKKGNKDAFLATADRILTEYTTQDDHICFDLLLWKTAEYLNEKTKAICEIVKRKIPNNTVVLVDEYQDLNPVQISILKNLMDILDLRVIFVGDEKQAIFQFRGACSNIQDVIIDQFSAIAILDLSVSFRCSGEVLREAIQWNPRMQYREGDGKVFRVSEIPKEIIDKPITIIARKNSSLLEQALTFITAGRSFYYKNEGFFNEVKNVIKEYDLNKWTAVRVLEDLKRLSEEKTIEHHDNPSIIKYWCDVYDSASVCVKYLYEHNMPFEKLNQIIKDAEHSKSTCQIMTVHKSKGLEFNTVVLLGATELYAANTEEEINLVYVAITRTIKCLYLVN